METSKILQEALNAYKRNGAEITNESAIKSEARDDGFEYSHMSLTFECVNMALYAVKSPDNDYFLAPCVFFNSKGTLKPMHFQSFIENMIVKNMNGVLVKYTKDLIFNATNKHGKLEQDFDKIQDYLANKLFK